MINMVLKSAPKTGVISSVCVQDVKYGHNLPCCSRVMAQYNGEETVLHHIRMA